MKTFKVFKDEDGHHQILVDGVNITQEMFVTSLDISFTADDVPYATIKVALPDGVEIDTDANISYKGEE